MFSNQTPNFGLPQYEQNDTLNVLSDFNGAMETIDSTMKTNELAAASAQSKADGADTKANNNATAITDLQTAQSADRTDINTLTGAVNTINSLIGNGEPTTTDKTIIGAINEVNGRVQEFGTHLIPYDIESVLVSVTADGVKTISQLLDDLFSAFATFIASAEDNEYIKFDYLHIDDIGDFAVSYSYVFINSSNISAETFDLNKSFTNGVDFFVAHDVSLRASGSSVKYYSNNGSVSSFGVADNDVPTAGKIIVLKGMTYKMI